MISAYIIAVAIFAAIGSFLFICSSVFSELVGVA